MGDWLISGAIGLVSGVLSGMFGIGGGIITTPAISLVLGAPSLIAVGTPLPVILPSAVTGAISYARHGLVDTRSGVRLGLIGSVTSIAGALLAALVQGRIVLLGTAALILWAAIDTVAQVLRPTRVASELAAAEEFDAATASRDTTTEASAPSAPRLGFGRLAIIGGAAGLYSGFFGLGGGFVLVPLLVRVGRFPFKNAIATSLVAVAVLSVPGTITHALLGHVDWRIALGLAIGVIPGAAIGARISIGAGERAMRLGFAALLVIVGALLAMQQLGLL